MNLFKLPQMVSKTSQIISENINEGFPGDPVVKNPAANAEDTGWIREESFLVREVSHAVGQLSPYGTATEPVL